MAKKPTENRLIVYGALTDLRKAEQAGTPLKANDYLKDILTKFDYLPRQEKAFIKVLLEGCQERKLTLDYVIAKYANTKNGKIKPAVKDLLRMSIYQILYMDSVPDSAAVNEAVLIAEAKGLSSLKNFINGVLRTIVREKDCISWPDREKEPISYLSVCYSVQEWTAGLFRKRLGMETAEKIFARMNEPAKLVVRVKESLTEEEITALEKAWTVADIHYQIHPYSKQAYILDGISGMDKVPGFLEGKITVQDISSQLSIRTLGLEKGMKVLDLCAAPGGKTILAAELVGTEGTVTSRDLTERKLERIRENMNRLKIQNVTVEQGDATVLKESDVDGYDAIIADLPCSGLGVMGRKNDIRYRVTREDLRTLASLQKDILDQAVQYLKKGGKLLYSTCTISKEENEDNREYIIKELGLKPVSMKENLPKDLQTETTEQGYLQLLPGIHDCDGFFISVYEK